MSTACRIQVLLAGALISIATVTVCWADQDSADSGATAAAAAPADALSAGHAAMQTPIDCPLRKQGIDPASLRPFEDVEKYIAFLDRPDRVKWQKPDEVIASLGLVGNETVVDLGAGSGYFTFRFAKALPNGKVVAADTEPEMIRHIHHKAMTEGIRNIEPQLVKPDDPAVPAEADLVFLCDVLHHVTNRAAWLAKLDAEMNAGARLVVIEFKEGDLPQGPPKAAKIPRAEIVRLVTGAGLVLDSEQDDLLPYQILLEFRKP